MSISNHTVYPVEKVIRTLEKLGFDDRQIKEVKLAHTYHHALDPDGTPSFLHGTTGHNQLIIIAKLANLLHEHYHAPAGQRRDE